MINIFFLFLVSFLFSENPILFSIKDYTVYLSDFYEQVPYNEWTSLDSVQKNKAKNVFLERELSHYDALSYGVHNFPENNIRLQARYNQLLVNNTYEHLVAFPLVDSLSLSLSKKHIKEEVSAFHLLIGYNGCKLPGSFIKTKKEAYGHALSIKKEIEKKAQNTEDSLSVSIFSSFAKKHSEDPSVSDNGGFIGWISWGRVMSSFQQEAFNLPFFTVSEPVLTPYGYHLILITDKRPSQYAYYKDDLLEDLSKKICLQGIPFDTLREASTRFDSSLVSSDLLFFNNKAINNLLAIIKEKEAGGARGNKGAYLDWFSTIQTKDVYFTYKNKTFGLGWFLAQLKQTPSTRVSLLRNSNDIKRLFKSFILQKEVVLLGLEKKVFSSPFFKKEYLNHKKNILKNDYLSFLINKIPPIDSSMVIKAYEGGLFKGEHISPKKVVYTEILAQNEEKINAIYNQYLLLDDFDVLLKSFKGSIKNPVSFTKNNPVVVSAFSLKKGDVSKPIEKKDGSFSLIRVEKFVDEIPFELSRVYAQIERKLKKEKQDSLKENLFVSLKSKYNISSFIVP